MKKLLNKLSNSGKIDVDSLREDSYSDEHIRKPSSLPSDSRDTSQEIKLKKSFSGGGSVGRDNDFNKKKSSSSGIKSPRDKELKEKLNESDDKALRKSGSRKNSMKKSVEIKNQDSMKSPALKNMFASSYEHQKDTALVDSDSSEDESVPRSRGNSMHDDEEFYTTMPIRVPSAPGRLASSPVPLHSTPPLAALHVSPRASDSPAPSSPYMHSPPASPFRPVAVPTSPTAGAQVPNLPRSVSTPSPRVAQNVVAADDFDLRFGVVGRPRNDSITDESETVLGSDYARSQAADDDEEDVDMIDDVEVTNQKGKTGLFSPRKNKAKKLK